MAWTQQDLEDAEKAIRAISTGATSYTINGRSVTKANLQDLHSWRAQIMREMGISPRFISGRLTEA